jgi:hypothetical protein
MTTGRINQVTLLSARAPPKLSSLKEDYSKNTITHTLTAEAVGV